MHINPLMGADVLFYHDLILLFNLLVIIDASVFSCMKEDFQSTSIDKSSCGWLC